MVTVFEHGPYLQAALFCEKVLQEQDGVHSIIRVIDRVTHTVVGPAPPEQMEPFSYPMTLVLMLKAGKAQGSFQVRVDIDPPSGVPKRGPALPVFLEGGERGVTLVVQMNIQFAEPGLYWFDVYFEDKLLTRMPFRVIYARTTTPGPPSTQ